MQRSCSQWVVAGLCLLMPLTVRAGPATMPHLSLAPGQKDAGTITLYISPEANTASRQIYLSGLKGPELASLKISCNLQPGAELRAAPPTVAVTWPANQPAATLTDDQWVSATLSVSNATA